MLGSELGPSWDRAVGGRTSENCPSSALCPEAGQAEPLGDVARAQDSKKVGALSAGFTNWFKYEKNQCSLKQTHFTIESELWTLSLRDDDDDDDDDGDGKGGDGDGDSRRLFVMSLRQALG